MEICKNQTNSSELEPLIASISNATNQYGSTTMASIGVLFNVFGLVEQES